jgi:hypothetical protein
VAGRINQLLRVKLNNELFLNLRVDLRTDRKRVHEHPQLVRDDLESSQDPLAAVCSP